jgi:hypothetical protein
MIGVEMFKTMLVTLAGAAAAVSLGTGVAQADSGLFSGSEGDRSGAAFTIDVADIVGGTVTAQTTTKAAEMANAVCSKLGAGVSEPQLIIAIAQPPNPMPVSDARYIIHAAEWHFCPTYY